MIFDISELDDGIIFNFNFSGIVILNFDFRDLKVWVINSLNRGILCYVEKIRGKDLVNYMFYLKV